MSFPPRSNSLRKSRHWKRQRPETEHGRDMWDADRDRQLARAWEDHAGQYGCEYGQVYLREVFKQGGCQACGKWHPPAELHHVVTRARLGKAEHQVVLGLSCHRFGHTRGWSALEQRHGVSLAAIALSNAAAGLLANWLPVEACALCLDNKAFDKAWHSTKFMLDQIIPEGSSPARICQWCAGDGPP
jgi:hypothetical protein